LYLGSPILVRNARERRKGILSASRFGVLVRPPGKKKEKPTPARRRINNLGIWPPAPSVQPLFLGATLLSMPRRHPPGPPSVKLQASYSVNPGLQEQAAALWRAKQPRYHQKHSKKGCHFCLSLVLVLPLLLFPREKEQAWRPLPRQFFPIPPALPIVRGRTTAVLVVVRRG